MPARSEGALRGFHHRSDDRVRARTPRDASEEREQRIGAACARASSGVLHAFAHDDEPDATLVEIDGQYHLCVVVNCPYSRLISLARRGSNDHWNVSCSPLPAVQGGGIVSGFKKFLLRGNVVDLAVGVAIGAAFNGLVAAFGSAFIKPLLGLVLGGGIKGGAYEVHGQVFDLGGFINAVITFLITATALYFLVVRPLNSLMERLHKTTEPDVPMRECPECLNSVPAAAHRCMHCTSELPRTQ